tara:strand:- start:254 stop:568 length:315 start_codon:yes stop_codon:yes gene_type:complete
LILRRENVQRSLVSMLRAARLRELNSFRYGSLIFHVHHSPLLGCWEDVFQYIDDVHREAVPRLVRERIVELNSAVRRAALVDRRRDFNCGFVQSGLKQVLRELW